MYTGWWFQPLLEGYMKVSWDDYSHIYIMGKIKKMFQTTNQYIQHDLTDWIWNLSIYTYINRINCIEPPIVCAIMSFW